MSNNIKIKGLTLTELMTAMAIAAIVVSMAIPTFSTTIARNRIVTHTNEFLGYLHYTRNEAITRGRRVRMCRSSNAINCDPEDGGWELGFIVFVDTNNNNVKDADEMLLRERTKFDSKVTITGNSMIDDYIAYSSDGRTRTNTGAFQSGTLNVCDKDTNLKSAIVISKVGRARSVKNCNKCPSSCSCRTNC